MFNADAIKQAIGIAHHKADTLLAWEAASYEQGDKILSAINQQNERKNYHRVPNAGVALTDGTCELRFRVRSGGWHLVSVAISGDTPTTATGCGIYRNDASDPINLLHVVTYGIIASDEFSDGEYVQEGEIIIVKFFGQTAGVRCTANLKYLNLVEPKKQGNH